ncbi:MAG: rhodanese-like domain-containing protein [Bradymonadia bacterium]
MKWILVIVAVFLVGFFLRSPADIKPEQAVALVAKGARLIDVRTPGEFSNHHIKGAVNIPLKEIAARASELGQKDEPIVLYCRSGNRSGQAQKILQKLGFKAVYNLGGISVWPTR